MHISSLLCKKSFGMRCGKLHKKAQVCSFWAFLLVFCLVEAMKVWSGEHLFWAPWISVFPDVNICNRGCKRLRPPLQTFASPFSSILASVKCLFNVASVDFDAFWECLGKSKSKQMAPFLSIKSKRRPSRFASMLGHIQEKEREGRHTQPECLLPASLCGTVHLFVHHLEHG